MAAAALKGPTLKTRITRSFAIVALLGLTAIFAAPALAAPAQPEHGVGANRAFEIWNDSATEALITVYRVEPNGDRTVVQTHRLKKHDRMIYMMHEGTKYVLRSYSVRTPDMHKIIQADDHHVDPNTVTKAYLRNADYRYYWQ